MHVRKRLFISLLGLAVAFIILLVLFIAFLAFSWNLPWHRLMLLLLASLVMITLGIVSCGIIGIVLTIWSARTIPSFQHLIRATLHLLFPIVLLLGRVLGISQERIRSSFIEVNNQMIRARREQVQSDQILVLAPHCLQNSECPHKITQSFDNCRRCGQCLVTGLISLREQYGVNLAFATGGTLARRFVQVYRPKAIIAIACDRDLASGIQDASPLPVLGIMNERPCGPCFNTRVNLQDVEAAIQFFASGPEVRIYQEGEPFQVTQPARRQG
ncbi:MAG: DUF116 domain-containing protein [Thermacetogeniaceae bacterium]